LKSKSKTSLILDEFCQNHPKLTKAVLQSWIVHLFEGPKFLPLKKKQLSSNFEKMFSNFLNETVENFIEEALFDQIILKTRVQLRREDYTKLTNFPKGLNPGNFFFFIKKILV
jgi:hypothetical protein